MALYEPLGQPGRKPLDAAPRASALEDLRHATRLQRELGLEWPETRGRGWRGWCSGRLPAFAAPIAIIALVSLACAGSAKYAATRPRHGRAQAQAVQGGSDQDKTSLPKGFALLPKGLALPVPKVGVGANSTSPSQGGLALPDLPLPDLRPAVSALQPAFSFVLHPFGTSTSTTTTTTTNTTTATTTTSTTTTNTTTTTTTTVEPGSLFCFALFFPVGYEMDLIRMQAQRGVSVFACQHTSLYSQGAVLVRDGEPQLWSVDIGSMATAKYFNAPDKVWWSLNSWVFVRVWQKVFDERTFELAAYTVKVDADAVFFPFRLQAHIQARNPWANEFFSNCMTNVGEPMVYGPLEVVSRGGMGTFSAGIGQCVASLSWSFNQYGEDVFFTRCLRQLQLLEVPDRGLLSQEWCYPHDPDPRQTGCYSGSVAFHDMKDVGSWLACFGQASR